MGIIAILAIAIGLLCLAGLVPTSGPTFIGFVVIWLIFTVLAAVA